MAKMRKEYDPNKVKQRKRHLKITRLFLCPDIHPNIRISNHGQEGSCYYAIYSARGLAGNQEG